MNKEKMFIILTDRHNSLYGDEWCLFWGHRESKGGYDSNPLTAHRFTEEEAKEIEGSGDYALDIEKLGLDKDYPGSINKNLRCLIEKGTVNKIYGLELRSN